MRKNLFHLFFIFILCTNLFSQKKPNYTVQIFKKVTGIAIRALYAVSDTEVWFASQRGVWGYTNDSGVTWHIDSIKVDSIVPEFRSMAVLNDSTVLLLGISSPAYLFKTTDKGKTWRIVYENNHKDIFFDCLKFTDEKNGIALGDPIDGKIQIIRTNDGGETWTEHKTILPKAETGEGFFAASNTNMKIIGKNTWMASGGMNTRVLHSKDNGKTFKSYNTPLPEGEIMTGIYSMDFWDSKNGIIAGGNYTKTDSAYVIMATTTDGGKTWKAFKKQPPDFGSCVQYLNKNEIFMTSKNGTFHINLKTEEVTELKDETNKALRFPTLRISPSQKVIWLGGWNGRIGMVKWDLE